MAKRVAKATQNSGKCYGKQSGRGIETYLRRSLTTTSSSVLKNESPLAAIVQDIRREEQTFAC